MHLSTWFAFIAASLAATFSPGPGVLLAITNSVSLGPRQALYSSAGNALGVFIVAGVSVTGFGLLLQNSVIAFVVLKTVGAAYLIYLGIRQWRSKIDMLQMVDNAPLNSTSRSKSIFNTFRRGMLVALTNPKAILFFTAVFPQFMPENQLDLLRFLILTSSFVVCVVISHLFYISLAIRLGNRSMSALRTGMLNRISGSIFVVLGTTLLTLRTHNS
jgi:homoserine/homoserine lactone efflux protein